MTYKSAIKILQFLEAAEHEVKDLRIQKPVHRVTNHSKPVHMHPKKATSHRFLWTSQHLAAIAAENLTKLRPLKPSIYS